MLGVELRGSSKMRTSKGKNMSHLENNKVHLRREGLATVEGGNQGEEGSHGASPLLKNLQKKKLGDGFAL